MLRSPYNDPDLSVLACSHADVTARADDPLLEIFEPVVCLRERDQYGFLFKQVMLVKNPPHGAMYLITPFVYKRLSTPVQFLHSRKRISLYELFFQVVEGRFDFAFLQGQ